MQFYKPCYSERIKGGERRGDGGGKREKVLRGDGRSEELRCSFVGPLVQRSLRAEVLGPEGGKERQEAPECRRGRDEWAISEMLVGEKWVGALPAALGELGRGLAALWGSPGF